MNKLINASDEQKIIIDKLETNNVIVNAVAGSGKTTTILHIANKYKNWKILVLTYNAKLKIESRQKCDNLKLKNIEIHSYHAFCVKYYNSDCYTDSKIQYMLNKNDLHTTFNYDLVVIDECQDMTPLYYDLCCKIIFSHKIKPKICILGDPDQNIFKYNGADKRFMELAKDVFNFNQYSWLTLKLSTSYRITNQMANFINCCIFNENKMKAIKHGPEVKYLICDVFGDYSLHIPHNEIMIYLNKYKYDDIFILAPSIKSPETPVRKLANMLSNQGIPIYVPNNDNDKIDSDIIKGKVVFSTFHQVKGLERNATLVFNFDKSYFDYFNKTASVDKCPNELYVAITRAKESMVLLHHYQNDWLPFIQPNKLKQFVEFKEYSKLNVLNKTKKEQKNISVTELIKYLLKFKTRKPLTLVGG